MHDGAGARKTTTMIYSREEDREDANDRTQVVSLTDVQLERLDRLEREMRAKSEYEERNRSRKLASSKRTGVPYDLVDTDVVRIATMFGLITSREKLEGGDGSSSSKKTAGSIIDVLLGSVEATGRTDYADVPAYFSLGPVRYREDDVVELRNDLVRDARERFDAYVSRAIDAELNRLASDTSLRVDPVDKTIESFVEAIRETRDVVLDDLESCNDYDRRDLLNQTRSLTNALLGFVPICDYKALVVDTIKRLERYGSTPELIASEGLSFVDANLSLYAGFRSVRAVDLDYYSDKARFDRAAKSHSRRRDEPFDMRRVLDECLVPSYMFLAAEEIIERAVTSPYGDFAVRYAADFDRSSGSSFYVLKSVTSRSSVRLWILDRWLVTFCERLRSACLEYCAKMTRTFVDEYGDEVRSSSVYANLTRALRFFARPKSFRDCVARFVQRSNRLVSTELDVFNEIDDDPNSQPPRIIELADRVEIPFGVVDDNEK